MSSRVTIAIPSPSRIARWAFIVLLVVAVLVAGVWIGIRVTSPSPAVSFSANGTLQEIQTAGQVYLGRVVADEMGYLRIAAPALVREQAAASGVSSQILVIRLTAQPFDVDGDLLIARDSVVSVANVARDSGLDRAYRQANGELPAPTASPSSS